MVAYWRTRAYLIQNSDLEKDGLIGGKGLLEYWGLNKDFTDWAVVSGVVPASVCFYEILYFVDEFEECVI